MTPIREYLMIGKLVALLAAIAIICWQSSQIHRWHKNAQACAEARKADSTAKNVQKSETQERIKVVTRTIREADGRARVVETAPPPGDCRTKPEVMNADV